MAVKEKAKDGREEKWENVSSACTLHNANSGIKESFKYNDADGFTQIKSEKMS